MPQPQNDIRLRCSIFYNGNQPTCKRVRLFLIWDMFLGNVTNWDLWLVSYPVLSKITISDDVSIF